jgi:hypothetical protein
MVLVVGFRVGRGGVEAGFERCLEEGNFDGQGKQTRRLEGFVKAK